MPRAPSEWSLDGNGVRFSVRVWRPDGAPRGAVCTIHGLGDHSRRSLHVAEAFVSRGFAVISPDLRGHGLSSGPRGHAASVDQLMQDLSLLMTDAGQRFGASRWTLYGHSMGGAIALAYALRRAESLAACIAVAPAIRTAFTPPAWKVAFGRVIRLIAPSLTLYNEVDPNGLSHIADVIRDYRADPLVHDRVSAALGVSLIDLGTQLLADAPSLKVPTLVVHGGDDRITSAPASREFADRAGPVCRYVEIKGAFHELHHEASWGETWGVIDGWIDATLPLARTY